MNSIRYSGRISLPYSLTHFVWETVQEASGRFQGHTRRVSAYPKVILKESEILHANAVAPALEFTRVNRISREPNSEFRAALEDYRKGDMADCLVKCGSAFESVLKVICRRKGWPYNQNECTTPRSSRRLSLIPASKDTLNNSSLSSPRCVTK